MYPSSPTVPSTRAKGCLIFLELPPKAETHEICAAQMVQVPNNLVFGFRAILIQILGRYLCIRYLDP